MRGYVLALRTEAKKTVQPKRSDHLLSSEGELLANTLWRFLQLRDFVNSDHTLSPWGVALSVGLEMLSDYPDLYDPLYLGLELFRLKALNHEEFSIHYPGEPRHGTGKLFPMVKLNFRRRTKSYQAINSSRLFNDLNEDSLPMERLSK